MSFSSPAAFLALALLAGVATAQPSPPRCEPDVRRILLGPESSPRPPEVCIQAGRTTTLLFDAPLTAEALRLEGRELFRQVEVAGGVLVLVPGPSLAPGTRLGLEVRFQEGSEPVAFVLVASPMAERQVEVSRPRGFPSPDAERQQAELQQCLQERARLAERLAQARSLAEVLASFEWTMDLRTLQLKPGAPGPGLPAALELQAFRYGPEAALRLSFSPPAGPHPWWPTRATLTGPSGERLELSASFPEGTPPRPGEPFRLLLEVTGLPPVAPGPYTLTVSEGDGARPQVFRNVRFP